MSKKEVDNKRTDDTDDDGVDDIIKLTYYDSDGTPTSYAEDGHFQLN